MRTANRTPVNDLSCESVDTEARSFDYSSRHCEPWDERTEEDSRGWSYIECVKCEKCGAILTSGGDRHSDIDPDTQCDGHVPSGDGPMMNYFYPLPNLDESDAAKLVDTCLCVVAVGDETGLALTGGGMDLTWEIAEAYMLIGHLPPVAFCRLPASGRGLNARDRWIVAGCLRSCEVAASWATRRADDIRAMVRKARKDAAGKRGAA